MICASLIFLSAHFLDGEIQLIDFVWVCINFHAVTLRLCCARMSWVYVIRVLWDQQCQAYSVCFCSVPECLSRVKRMGAVLVACPALPGFAGNNALDLFVVQHCRLKLAW